MSTEGESLADGDELFVYSPDEPNQPAATIIEAISTVRGVDPIELEPLADAVDFDAMNTLFGRNSIRGMIKRTANSSVLSDLRIVFEYAGCLVTVRDGHVTVRVP